MMVGRVLGRKCRNRWVMIGELVDNLLEGEGVGEERWWKKGMVDFKSLTGD